MRPQVTTRPYLRLQLEVVAPIGLTDLKGHWALSRDAVGAAMLKII